MPVILHAVYDSNGVIIAASRSDPDDHKSSPAPIPQASAGNYYAAVSLDEAQARMPVDQLCKTSRIDAQSRRLISSDLRSSN